MPQAGARACGVPGSVLTLVSQPGSVYSLVRAILRSGSGGSEEGAQKAEKKAQQQHAVADAHTRTHKQTNTNTNTHKQATAGK